MLGKRQYSCLRESLCRPYGTQINFPLTQHSAIPPQFAAKTARLGDPGSAACWTKLFRVCGAGFLTIVLDYQCETLVLTQTLFGHRSLVTFGSPGYLIQY